MSYGCELDKAYLYQVGVENQYDLGVVMVIVIVTAMVMVMVMVMVTVTVMVMVIVMVPVMVPVRCLHVMRDQGSLEEQSQG